MLCCSSGGSAADCDLGASAHLSTNASVPHGCQVFTGSECTYPSREGRVDFKNRSHDSWRKGICCGWHAHHIAEPALICTYIDVSKAVRLAQTWLIIQKPGPFGNQDLCEGSACLTDPPFHPQMTESHKRSRPTPHENRRSVSS